MQEQSSPPPPTPPPQPTASQRWHDKPVSLPQFIERLAINKQALEICSTPAAVIGADGRLLAANRLFSRERGLCDADNLSLAQALKEPLEQAMKEGHSSPCMVLGGDEALIFKLTAVKLEAADPLWLLLAEEATVEVNMRNALIESRARYMDIVALSGESAWETAADGSFTFVTANGLGGFAPRQLIGSDPSLLFDPNHAAPTISPFMTPVAVSGADVWLRHADGPAVCFEISAVPLYKEDGVWSGARGICRDVTEDRLNRAYLAKHRGNERLITRISEIFRQKSKPDELLMAAAEACMRGLAANGCQIVGIADGDDHPGSIGAPLAMVGICGAESDGAGWKMLEDGLDPEAEFRIGSRQGWSVLRAPTIYAGRMVGAILLWRNPSQPVWNEADAHLVANLAGHLAAAMVQRTDYLRLLNAARTDPLTGIFNRRAFDDELARRLHRLNRDRRRGSLLYVDLDNFKVVNDIRGHDIGDDALCHVADILRANTRGTDLLARLGGDEFVIWLEDVTEKEAIKRAKTFLAAATSLSVYSGSPSSPLQMSIGIALYDPKSTESVAGLMKRADNAMYYSKQSGKGTYAIAEPPEDAE